jgi:hypothetical protein
MYDKGHALLTMDVKNAHNSISRSAMWSSINNRKDSLPFVRAFFRLAYAKTTTVYFQKKGNDFLAIETNEGTRQGCTVAQFSYNLTTGDALAPAVGNLADGVGFGAIQDDLTANSANTAHLVSFYYDVCSCLATVGLEVNPSK